MRCQPGVRLPRGGKVATLPGSSSSRASGGSSSSWRGTGWQRHRRGGCSGGRGRRRRQQHWGHHWWGGGRGGCSCRRAGAASGAAAAPTAAAGAAASLPCRRGEEPAVIVLLSPASPYLACAHATVCMLCGAVATRARLTLYRRTNRTTAWHPPEGRRRLAEPTRCRCCPPRLLLWPPSWSHLPPRAPASRPWEEQRGCGGRPTAPLLRAASSAG